MKRIILVFIVLVLIPQKIAADQLIITDEDKMIESINRWDYASPYFGNLLVEQVKLEKLIKEINEKITRQPLNAMFNDQNEIVEGVIGEKLDIEKFTALFLSFFYSKEFSVVEAPRLTIYPRVNSELLAEISEKLIGYYVTYYKESNEERSHNIYLSTKSVNNQVVFPGETFSFNQIVGKRTVDKGYKKAPVIVKGELSEGIGGGICQVSSTLFNAVNLKGIQVVERYSHSRTVPYVPPGKDATVSWWGPDLVFKNNYSHPILIRATSESGKVKIYIYSSGDVHVKDQLND